MRALTGERLENVTEALTELERRAVVVCEKRGEKPNSPRRSGGERLQKDPAVPLLKVLRLCWGHDLEEEGQPQTRR